MRNAITVRNVLTVSLFWVLAASLAAAQPAAPAAPAGGPLVIHRSCWDYNRSDFTWYDGKDHSSHEGGLRSLCGWVEFDVQIPTSGWYEWYCCGGTWDWEKTYYVDGKQVFFGGAQPEDTDRRKDLYKIMNLPLSAGQHTLRIMRLGFPGTLPDWFELRAANNNPLATVTAEAVGPNLTRVGVGVNLKVTGGCSTKAATYEFMAMNTATGEGQPAGSISFPASDKFLVKTINLPTPVEGCFRLRVQEEGTQLKPADFLFYDYAAVDTRTAPPAAATLQRTLVKEIDCVTEEPLKEKDGPTRIVEAPFGKYRESSGQGTRAYWSSTS